MGTTHPPIIHTGGHLVPPPRRSARGQAGLHSLLQWGNSFSFFPAPQEEEEEEEEILLNFRSTRGDKKRGIEFEGI